MRLFKQNGRDSQGCINVRHSCASQTSKSLACNAGVFGERAYLDQACAILGSNSEEAWGETKKRPRESECYAKTNMAANLLNRALFVNTRKTRALQASKCLAPGFLPMSTLFNGTKNLKSITMLAQRYEIFVLVGFYQPIKTFLPFRQQLCPPCLQVEF